MDAASSQKSQPASGSNEGPLPGTSSGGLILKRKNPPSNAKSYPMNGAKRGKAVIFNQTFKGEGKNERKGTEKDVKRLKLVLPKLGFQSKDIEVHNELTSEEIKAKAKKRE